jgi:hypothetical protein
MYIVIYFFYLVPSYKFQKNDMPRTHMSHMVDFTPFAICPCSGALISKFVGDHRFSRAATLKFVLFSRTVTLEFVHRNSLLFSSSCF